MKEMNTYLKTLVYNFPPRTIILRLSNTSSSSNLPKLPVPSLQDTLKKYLKSVEPFLSKEEKETTDAKVKQFGCPSGVGDRLQKLLECRAEVTENWLAEWWLNYSYLGYRFPVTAYSSPGLVFPKRKFKDDDERLSFASKLVTAAIDYKLIIDRGGIPQEKFGKNSLDMSQYHKIFGTCRVPKIPLDDLVFNSNEQYIIVIHNNRFFKLKVIHDKNVQASESQVKEALKEIINLSQEAGPPVGILTSSHRDKWSAVYKELCQDISNKESLDVICKSLFTLSFDKCCYKPDTILKCKTDHMTIAGYQTITGGGSKFNGGNRWFDKTIQFVIDPDGHNGLTYEHSPAEGQPIAVMMDHIIKYIDGSKGNDKPPEKGNKLEFNEVRFNITPFVNGKIKLAAKDLDDLNHIIDLECFKYTGYGKHFIKSQKLSPDSYIQIAIQLAFYRIHKVPGAHYESASTRMFIHGRTETIRSCSVESIDFCQSMLDKFASDIEKARRLRKAVNSHKEYTNQALQGLGVDRHLFGLKIIAKENNVSLPDLYDDVSYTRSTYMRISTSQVASQFDSFMVYCPLVDDGYGCCYNPMNNDINFGTSAFKTSTETSALQFKESLIQSFDEMKKILEQVPQSQL